jgi:hypothetical protein
MDKNDESKEKLLRIIEGGKVKPNSEPKPAGRVGKALSGLTLKQEEFAKQLADGATNSDAYRAAYNCDGMAASTVHQEGCKLAQHPKIAERVEDILREKQAKKQLVAARAEDRIWKQVWEVLEGNDTPAAVKVSAAALAAKLAGMVTDKVQVDNVSSTDLEKELQERLKQYVSR